MKWVFIILLMWIATCAVAQEESDYKYERGSLYMMMIKHPNRVFNKEIEFVFNEMDKPDRFNDHDLGVKVVQFAEDNDQVQNIHSFMKQVQLAKRIVAKWFNRDKDTGNFDMELVKERGNYNATILDVQLAKEQIRGLSLLEDAGEKLISNTYLVVNDICYIDKSNKWQIIKDGLNMATTIAEPWLTKGVVKLSKSDDPFDSAYNWLYSGLLDNIKGFRVKVTSYLFRLKWSDDVANHFYTHIYTTESEEDKIKHFLENKDLFVMEYVGMVEDTSTKTSMFGVKTNEDLIKKVCTRALDKNLAKLQQSFSDFRIKAPLIETSPLKAYIGLKEDVSNDSRFEVLERVMDEEGRVEYKRVGMIRPVKNKIWDNRFMAMEEGIAEAELNATEFQKVSGDDFYAGMLIREVK